MTENPGLRRRGRGFTLTELLVVAGLIMVLLSLLVPVLSKARSAANAASCASNLRQLGTGWTMYVAENRGRLPHYIFSTPTTPDLSWRGYWPGILESFKVSGDVMFCPSASEVWGLSSNRGFGNATRAWTGKVTNSGTGIRFNLTLWREGSYGYNRYLTVAGGFGPGGKGDKITAVRRLSEVPLFMDCAYADVMPPKGTELFPVSVPADLTGAKVTISSPEHWRILLARHGRGINVCMADGSARWVPLEETYEMQWTADWTPFRLALPPR